MSTEQLIPGDSDSFQHRPQETGCNCPIHRNQTKPPFTAPLGYEFADDVTVEPISRQQATEIYRAHHGYMSGDLHPANFVHHGIYYQDLLGAITYRFPRFSKKNLHFDADGNLVQEPYTESDFEDLPDAIEPRARRLLNADTHDQVARVETVIGNECAEANRICIGERMPNLASCSLARSQEAFIDSAHCPDSIDYLITYVVAEFEGSMIKALRGKGWTCIGWSEPSRAGNREHKQINDRFKWVFACPVETIREQRYLDEWGG